MCEHEWTYEYYADEDDKEYVVCSKCGLTREVCKYCDKFSEIFYSDNSVFEFSINKMTYGTILNIYSEHEDQDEIKINFCPMCGKKLGR